MALSHELIAEESGGEAQAPASIRKFNFTKAAGTVIGAAVLLAGGYAMGRRAGTSVRGKAFTMLDNWDSCLSIQDYTTFGRCFSAATEGHPWAYILHVEDAVLGVSASAMTAEVSALHNYYKNTASDAERHLFSHDALVHMNTHGNPTYEQSCTANGQDCSASHCCSEPGMTCFKKNDHWSSCNQTCSPNMKWVEDAWQGQEEPVWDCEVLSHSYSH